jgi:hypothetical protein
VAGALWLPAAAQADFALKDLDVAFESQGGSIATQAGTHPFSFTTTLGFNTVFSEETGFDVPDGDPKDIIVAQMDGLVGNPAVVPPCSNADFSAKTCSRSSQIGLSEIEFEEPGHTEATAIFSVEPPPGVAMKIGFVVQGLVPVTIELRVSESYPYNVIASVTNTPNTVAFYRSALTIWGVPADPAHDKERGGPSGLSPEPFLTTPRACTGPLATSFKADSWQDPGAWFEESVLTHDEAEPPSPQGMTGCGQLGFGPSITAVPTSKASSSPSGLDFSLDVNDEGLANPSEEARANSDIRKTVVTLPEGFSVNPSIAEGLEVCTEADLARETSTSAPGAGCPEAAKIGTVEVTTPLLDEAVSGSLYQAAPYENPFGSLIALYLVIKNKNLGIKIAQPLEVEPDPATGRLVTIAEDLPQLPFSHFRLHFREGARSPLVTPPGCGTYTAEAKLYPWAGGPPLTSTSAFAIITGPAAGPCPTAGTPPFRPNLIAGTLSNAAGRFSPFNVRITRTDSEQEITHFSIKLPPGVAGVLAGIPACSDAQIARAAARTGPHGGAEELADPSCPAASQVGRTLAGSGVGPSLAYAPGKVYLAGPYRGAPLSFVSITAGVVGPFDIGTVVVRLAIRVNPRTGEVFLDSTGSDPIPHIIKGIPVHLREIRAYTDRPNFTFNPTSCEPMSTAATVLGSGLDFASPADDLPFVSTSRFQAADCAALRFKPKLDLRLLGGTRRGAHPRFRARLTMPPGGANISKARVTLPGSAFLDQSHIRTVCTRVAFAQDACPAASVYGYAEAVTPLLDAPLTGPVYLRSSENKLPDLVAALRSREGIRFELVGRVDSVKGRIRNTFDVVPDAPVSSFTLTMQGGDKGLITNSRNLCFKPKRNRARADFEAHNGRARHWKPVVKAKCGKKKGKKRSRNRRSTSR